MTHATPELELSQCIGSGTLWNALNGDPLLGVMVVCMKGKIAHANNRAAEMLVAADADAAVLVGRQIAEALPPVAAELHMHQARQAKETGRSSLLREIWRGRQVVTRFTFVRSESCEGMEFEDGGFLAVSRHVDGGLPEALGTDEAAKVTIANYVDFGHLDVLSDREIEVLSLLCTGLTAKEIAAKLDRSFKTVENHRYVIGRKLDAMDRHALAAMAIRAGLTSKDALRDRI